jgi:hypothetical protein
MSSVSRFMKQIPLNSQYYISLVSAPTLNIFIGDPQSSTTSYVSGAAEGYFSTSTLSLTGGPGLANPPGSNGTQIFRDMGKSVVSSGRTFRRIQLLTLDSNGGTGWTSTTAGTAGVWQPGREGVTGSPVVGSTADSAFNVFYFETGANGLGISAPLIRYS